MSVSRNMSLSLVLFLLLSLNISDGKPPVKRSPCFPFCGPISANLLSMQQTCFPFCTELQNPEHPSQPEHSAVSDQTSSSWYLAMLENKHKMKTVRLRQEDFVRGTVRIREPGYYILMEDINFNPMRNGSHAEYPLDDDHDEYPQGQYIIGFFAAITIETKGVWLDLNGKTIQQGIHNYIKQRFFSVIELADRVFIPTEGTGSLNFNPNDHLHFDKSRSTSGCPVSGRKVGGNVAAEETIVENGVIGRSSHWGMHGNGMKKIVVRNIVIRDFEVTGAQFNGGEAITLKNVKIGPGATEAPAGAYLSSTIYLVRHLVDIVPRRWKNVDIGIKGEENDISDLLETKISFADRPGQDFAVKDVFARAARAVDLYVNWVKKNVFKIDADIPMTEEENDEELLTQALHLFNERFETIDPNNPKKTGRFTDGGSMYGLQFHRMGASVENLGNQDDNYYGPTTGNVWIEDVTIKDLVGKMKMVPGFTSATGKTCKGTNEEMIPILDILGDNGSGRLWSSPKATFYRGNFLIDTYVAELVLSSKYYRRTIWDSACGNFGSNHTAPEFGPEENCKMTTKPGDAPLKGEYGPKPGPNHGPNAFLKSNRHYSYNGRDTAMFQKKYFGGTQCSHQFIDWATTPGATIDQLLAVNPNPLERRRTQNKVTCNKDIMSHISKGVIGIRAGFQRGLLMKNVTIRNLVNLGDNDQSLCKQRWVGAAREGRYGGADVSGVRLQKNTLVTVDKLNIRDLDSDEGKTTGIAIIGDTNDRTDWQEEGKEYLFKAVKIRNLKAASGDEIVPFKADQSTWMNLNGIDAGEENAKGTLNHNFDLAKRSYVIGSKMQVPCGDADVLQKRMERNRVPRNLGGDFSFSSALATANLTVEDEQGLARQTASFFHSHYGVKFGEFSFSEMSGAAFAKAKPEGLKVEEEADMQYGVVTCDGHKCVDNGDAEIVKYAISLKPENSFYTAHGVFGDSPQTDAYFVEQKFAGTQIDETAKLSAGGYTLTRDDQLCGLDEKHILQLHGIHPHTLSRPTESISGSPINTVLESRVLGQGKADGIILTQQMPDGQCERTEWQLWQFDDSNNGFPSNGQDGCTKATRDQDGANKMEKMDKKDTKMLLVATADGCGKQNRHLNGFGSKPLGNGHLKINEAPILEREGAFKRWMKMEDTTILAFRTKFVKYLTNYIGHQFSKENVENINNDLINQTTAVGTGSVIKPYEITQDANLRVIISKSSDGKVKSYRGARVHEVGFVYQVGAGGTVANFGSNPKKKYFYEGAEMSWGFYIIENVLKESETDEDKTPIVVEFQDRNLWNPTSDLHLLISRDIVGVYQMKKGKLWEEREVLQWGAGKVEGVASTYFSREDDSFCANIKLFFSWS